MTVDVTKGVDLILRQFLPKMRSNRNGLDD